MPGKTLAQGLMASSGEQLRLIYVLVMETGITNMIANKTKDLFDKKVDHSQQQLESEMKKLKDIDDNTLRLELFLHMTKDFELPGSYYNTSYEIENKCKEILQTAHAYQRKKDKKYNEFVSRNSNLPIDSQLALYQMQKIFESVGGEFNNLTAEQQESFADQIENFVESLPKEQQTKIKEKLNIDDITNSTIKKVIATQGSAVLLAVIVEIAGFAAYTTLTSLIAGTAGLIGLTLPFGVYMTATSVLSVLTGPVGLLLIGGASGVMMLTQSKKVKKTLLQMGIVQLLLPILLDNSKVYEYHSLIEQWSTHYNRKRNLVDALEESRKEYSSVAQNLKSIKDDIAKNNTIITENSNAYNQIVNQLADSLGMISDYEMTDDFRKRKIEIANLEEELQDVKESIKRNKQKITFMDKMSGMFSNISLESDVNKLRKQLQNLRKEQAIEMLSICPLKLTKECNEARHLMEEKKIALRTVTKQEEQKRLIETNLAIINTIVHQKQDELRSLHKEIYGLGDIE